MHPQLPLVLVLAFAWGVCVAAFMQFTVIGNFLSREMTWFMTALGSGGVLLLLLFVMDSDGRIMWWYVPTVYFVASLGPSFRGIWLHKEQIMEVMTNARNTAT